MIDRNKVVKGLEVCIPLDEGENCPTNCPYYQDVCFGYNQLMRDALALLKEQEPLEPIYNEEKYGDHLPHCGNCEKVLPNNAVYGKVNFCQYCGRSVKWE